MNYCFICFCSSISQLVAVPFSNCSFTHLSKVRRLELHPLCLLEVTVVEQFWDSVVKKACMLLLCDLGGNW